MKISEIFARSIDREVDAVIKVSGGAKEKKIEQELDEYVVTKELLKLFTTFYRNYQDFTKKESGSIGVWISGLYGSGKSHLLKMLAYLLDSHKKVGGRRALDFFKEKIEDAVLWNDMNAVASAPTDVLLFDVDSKNRSAARDGKTILNVFLNVFNEYESFCPNNPHLADLERNLVERSLLEQFKTKFSEKANASWEEKRSEFGFWQDEICDTLTEIGATSIDAAKNWCEQALTPYEISPEEFVQKVVKRVESKDPNLRLLFLVDEIGQFIGDNDKLMLSLQTLTQLFGVHGKGKFWIMVTSQEAIEETLDRFTASQQKNFSKIRGRFDTTLSLSSSDVDEVVRRRLLAKTPTAEQTLEVEYEQNATQLKNIISFDVKSGKQQYASKEDFAATYPFVPYQFALMEKVLAALRTISASNAHMSQGERSMISAFKKTAEALKDQNVGSLVPFYAFYDALELVIDGANKKVIDGAAKNERLEPFDVDVLKILFMIKYVDKNSLASTISNITTLMISNVDEDRVALQKKVEAATLRLEKQTLIQRNGESYEFLSDDEQEINRQIKRISIGTQEIVKEIGEIFFQSPDSASQNCYDKLTYKKNYVFPLNRYVDSIPIYERPANRFGVRFVTPFYDGYDDKRAIEANSRKEKNVFVVLPKIDAIVEELELVLKIRVFVNQRSADGTVKQDIFEKKIRDRIERLEHAKAALIDAATRSEIYVLGSRISGSGDLKALINEALTTLVAQVCDKIDYVEILAEEKDVLATLQEGASNAATIAKTPKNAKARDEILVYLDRNDSKKITVKDVLDRFRDAPYCFKEYDVYQLLARLFVDGEITLTRLQTQLSLRDGKTTPEQLHSFLVKNNYQSQTFVARRRKVDSKQIKKVKGILADFQAPIDAQDETTVFLNARAFFERLNEDLPKIETYFVEANVRNVDFKALKVVRRGRELLRKIVDVDEPTTFFAILCGSENDWRDFAEDYQPIGDFWKSENQRQHVKDTLGKLRIYNVCNEYSTKAAVLSEIAEKIRQILSSDEPFRQIKELPPLNKRFDDVYRNVVCGEKLNIYEKIQASCEEALSIFRTRISPQGYAAVGERFAVVCDAMNTFARNLRQTENSNEFVETFAAERSRLTEAFNAAFESPEKSEPATRLRDVFFVADAVEQSDELSKIAACSWKTETTLKNLKELPEYREPEPGNDSGVPTVQPVDQTTSKPPQPVSTQPEPRSVRLESLLPLAGRTLRSEADVDALLDALRTRLFDELNKFGTVKISSF